jgi:uncharacterized SAM-binding protein YcdF (DUF218 family)
MTLSVLVYGIGLFIVALTMHVLVWNLFRIRKEILWLAVIFFVIPGIILAASSTAGLLDATAVAACGMLYVAMAVAYIQTYPALREDIPSVRILMSIHSHSGSMTCREIVEHLAPSQLFEPKIAELENDFLIRIRDDRLHLTALGGKLSGVFYYYRKLLGHEAGRG